MREQDVVCVLFVCEKRGRRGKVVERDAQETKIVRGERSKLLEESMVAQLQQNRTRGRIGVRGIASAIPRENWDDDFFRRNVHPPSLVGGWGKERETSGSSR